MFQVGVKYSTLVLSAINVFRKCNSLGYNVKKINVKKLT